MLFSIAVIIAFARVAFTAVAAAAPQAPSSNSYRAPWLRGVAKELAIRQGATYTNPIIDGNFADPWVLKWNNSYYLLPTMSNGGVSVFKSDNLADFHKSKAVQVWMPPNPGAWAPELHRIDGNWYIYTALPDGPEDADRRMHALKGSNPNDPTAPFTDLGNIGTSDSNYAIDGTVLQNYNGKNYFIWSGKVSRDAGLVQYLYIAEMNSPSSVVGKRVMIHSPYYPDGSKKGWQWTTNGYGINEGPEVLQHGGQTFVIYSACGSWDACYSLGIIGLKGPNLDPLNPASWWANDDGPIFAKSSVTVGTGHASFTEDRNGVPYIVYHAWAASDNGGWGSRKAFAQKFGWNEDGTPKFPVAVAMNVSLPLPA